MESLLLSCRALSSPTICRFIPAHVAVGTTIADRPPHRSVRAALPHTAPTSDDSAQWKQGAHPPNPGTRRTRTVPGACGSGWCSPWFAPFPPPPPLRLAPPCSAASLVLRRDPTPPGRTRPACGYWPSRTGPQTFGGRPRGLPVLVHIVSRRARGLRLRRVRRAARELAPPADVAFPQSGQGRHPNLSFRSSIPCPPVPLSTLRPPPRDDRRKTRGQDGVAAPFL